ncbi:DUF3899 domain-containing protein [Peribacillus glennii]|uniref:DUF3899 domain-containing protein n=1 Tax=Peribacillus glennii TaxID=2303991 RepID=UPI001314D4E3|nr:DUF3899 domain-containing protein [Peribacillus glennii]
MKKILKWTGVALILIFLLSFLLYREISLLHFINISFYISGTLLCLSLFSMVIQTGFFDRIFFGFRTVMTRGDNSGKEKITPLSELVSFRYNAMLASGILLLSFMLVALIFYYL